MAAQSKSIPKPEPRGPLYWFIRLELARERADFAAIARAQRELRLLGVVVEFGSHRSMSREQLIAVLTKLVEAKPNEPRDVLPLVETHFGRDTATEFSQTRLLDALNVMTIGDFLKLTE